MLLNKKDNVIQRHLDSLQKPDICDIKIRGCDGEVAANKLLLRLSCQFFSSMFSPQSNFAEHEAGSITLPHTKTVLEKVVTYLYSGQMDCEQMDVTSLLELLGLLSYMNLSEELSTVELFAVERIKSGHFPLLDCLKALDISSQFGLEMAGQTLVFHLGQNIAEISQMEAVGSLSQDWLIRLVEEKKEVRGQTFARFQTLVRWLSVNVMDSDMKEEVIRKVDFDHFTFKEFVSDVRKSGLFPVDKVIERMEQLFDAQKKETEAWKSLAASGE